MELAEELARPAVSAHDSEQQLVFCCSSLCDCDCDVPDDWETALSSKHCLVDYATDREVFVA